MDNIYSEGMLYESGKAVAKKRGRGHFDQTRNKTYTWAKSEELKFSLLLVSKHLRS